MVFGRYARYYDTIYHRKEYNRECRFLKSVFSRYSSFPVSSILDIGCGTGNHLLPLIRSGYRVTGIDGSAGMLKIAEAKLAEQKFSARLIQSRMQNFQLRRRFDAVICMFSVIDYLIKDDDLRSMLACVAAHLKQGGLFIFDFWQSSAAEQHYSPRRNGIFKKGAVTVQRRSRTLLHKARRTFTIDYSVAVRETDQKTEKFRERHVLRYFDIEEIAAFCRAAGLEIVKIGPFFNLNAPIRQSTWDITMVTRKRSAR